MEESASDRHSEKDLYGTARASKFQFKAKSEKRSKRQRSAHDGEDDDENTYSSKRHRSDEEGGSGRRHRHAKRRHKHRHHERAFTRSGEYDDPDRRYRESLYDELNNNRVRSPHLDSDAVFRESLFDAMADDEGADYWEAVYGQPIHIYPNTKPGPDGKLERMTDEEYADFVRTKMWEKSHQHILEERAARERARQRRKEQNDNLEHETAAEEAERETIRRQMEDSLQRGAERKKAKEAEASWAKYLSRWEHLKSKQEPGPDPREIIPWPVASGRASQMESRAIEQFFRSSSSWREDALALLKIERVRWHPDKMQQRFGQHIDSETMKLVTAVFQVIDRLWNERNGRRR